MVAHPHGDFDLLVFLRVHEVLEVSDGLGGPGGWGHVGVLAGRLDACQQTSVAVEWSTLHPWR